MFNNNILFQYQIIEYIIYNDSLNFLCRKTFEKCQKIRKLTCLNIAVEPIQVGSNIIIATIFYKTFSFFMSYVSMATT